MQDISIKINKKEFSNIDIDLSPYIVIKDFNLNIPKGQFCSIIGPSGCGKTTLLNLISGLDKSLDGTISYGDDNSLKNTKIAYMFQTPRLLPWLNVIQNVEIVLNRKQRNSSKSKEILSLMGLKDFLHYYPNKLSGGMQRRVALARSFATEPELLILDEPFVSLDEPVANLLRKMLVEIWEKQPTTIIFVTHDITEAIYLSDKIIFLSKSPTKVIKESTIKISRPRTVNSEKVNEMKKTILSKNNTILKGEL